MTSQSDSLDIHTNTPVSTNNKFDFDINKLQIKFDSKIDNAVESIKQFCIDEINNFQTKIDAKINAAVESIKQTCIEINNDLGEIVYAHSIEIENLQDSVVLNKNNIVTLQNKLDTNDSTSELDKKAHDISEYTNIVEETNSFEIIEKAEFLEDEKENTIDKQSSNNLFLTGQNKAPAKNLQKNKKRFNGSDDKRTEELGNKRVRQRKPKNLGNRSKQQAMSKASLPPQVCGDNNKAKKTDSQRSVTRKQNISQSVKQPEPKVGNQSKQQAISQGSSSTQVCGDNKKGKKNDKMGSQRSATRKRFFSQSVKQPKSKLGNKNKQKAISQASPPPQVCGDNKKAKNTDKMGSQKSGTKKQTISQSVKQPQSIIGHESDQQAISQASSPPQVCGEKTDEINELTANKNSFFDHLKELTGEKIAPDVEQILTKQRFDSAFRFSMLNDDTLDEIQKYENDSFKFLLGDRTSLKKLAEIVKNKGDDYWKELTAEQSSSLAETDDEWMNTLFEELKDENNLDDSELVYNPISVNKCLQSGEINSLITHLRSTEEYITKVHEFYEKNDLSFEIDISFLHPSKITVPVGSGLELLMFRYGILTLDKPVGNNIYKLKYPNEEVKNMFIKKMKAVYEPIDHNDEIFTIWREKVSNGLRDSDIRPLVEFFNINASRIEVFEYQTHFQELMSVMLKGMGYAVTMEDISGSGRTDIVLKYQISDKVHICYVIEIKKIQDLERKSPTEPTNGFKQIQSKLYVDRCQKECDSTPNQIVTVVLVCDKKKIIYGKLKLMDFENGTNVTYEFEPFDFISEVLTADESENQMTSDIQIVENIIDYLF